MENLITESNDDLIIPIYFIKFFETEEYADQFITGKLYSNSLSYFKKMEKNYDSNRPDIHEAVAIWLQPENITINFKSLNITLTGKDFAAPISISRVDHDYLHIFCMYSVNVSCHNKIELTEEDFLRFKEQFRIDERCLKFGEFAVIINAHKLIKHLKEAQRELEQQGYYCTGGLVDYYDDTVFHGKIDEKDAPFKKQKRFSYQNEYRICVEQEIKNDNPIIIDIGNINHLCVKIESSNLADFFDSMACVNV